MNIEARLSARALAEVKVGGGEEELWCNSLLIVCKRRRGLSEDEETRATPWGETTGSWSPLPQMKRELQWKNWLNRASLLAVKL